jgi:putative hydrolase of the HAD superfamily
MSDVAGAKGAGLFAIWFNPDGRPFPSRTLAPDAQVRALSEVPALVGVGEAAASR